MAEIRTVQRDLCIFVNHLSVHCPLVCTACQIQLNDVDEFKSQYSRRQFCNYLIVMLCGFWYGFDSTSFSLSPFFLIYLLRIFIYTDGR